MGLIGIDCYCEEVQMQAILSLVEKRLYSSLPSEVEDVDEEIFDMRVCVSYNVFMNDVRLSHTEVLDNDWDLLYEDTAVLNSRLKKVVEEYNLHNKGAYKRANRIRENERENQ